jgi:hypothetical protein
MFGQRAFLALFVMLAFLVGGGWALFRPPKDRR